MPFVLTLATALFAQDPDPAAAAAVAAATRAAADAAFAQALPPAAEARWMLVPWRRSLAAALAEAKATGKILYLFVNDGAVDSGRC